MLWQEGGVIVDVVDHGGIGGGLEVYRKEVRGIVAVRRQRRGGGGGLPGFSGKREGPSTP